MQTQFRHQFYFTSTFKCFIWTSTLSSTFGGVRNYFLENIFKTDAQQLSVISVQFFFPRLVTLTSAMTQLRRLGNHRRRDGTGTRRRRHGKLVQNPALLKLPMVLWLLWKESKRHRSTLLKDSGLSDHGVAPSALGWPKLSARPTL